MKNAAAVLAVILVVGLGGFIVLRGRIAAASAASLKQYKTVATDRGTVKKTVSSTGVLQAWTTVDIKSKAGGIVLKMNVDEGTHVKPGQVIAIIDPTDTQLTVDQAKADIDSADAKINQSQVTWELQRKQSELAVEQARASQRQAEDNLAAAKARLDQAAQQSMAQPDLTNSNIASAKANLVSAQKQLAQLKEASNPQEEAAAQSAYDQCVANTVESRLNLERMKKLFDQAFTSEQTVEQAQAAFDVARAAQDSAKRKLDTLKAEQGAAVASQEARVQQADAQYRNTLATRVDIDIRRSALQEARANLRQQEKAVSIAHKALDLAIANVANNDIRKADIASATATRFRAQAGLKNANITLSQTVVRAPSDGVVLKKYVEQGTIIQSALGFATSGQAIVNVGDVTRMYVDVAVDETDIANVDDGQAVDVTMDAYPGIPFQGKVIRISPQAVVDQNVTNVHVRVELDNSDVKFQLLKPGMNATCEFVKKKKENVLRVQNEAVHTDDQGKFVQVATGGRVAPPDEKTGQPADPGTLVQCKIENRRINTQEDGLEGNDYTEVTSGLKEGEIVVTQTIEPVVQQAGGALGSGFGRPPVSGPRR